MFPKKSDVIPLHPRFFSLCFARYRAHFPGAIGDLDRIKVRGKACCQQKTIEIVDFPIKNWL
jgi:hypothetical protein